MADDDLILTLRFDPTGDYVPGPPDPVPPAMGSCGAELYAAMRPLAGEDHLHDWALAHLCEAIGRMRQAVSDIVRERDVVVDADGPDGPASPATVVLPGWASLTDVDFAPGADSEIDALPFLAQLAGVRGIEQLGDEDRRTTIRERPSFWRGTIPSIVAAVQRHLSGGRRVLLRERFDPDDAGDRPYHLHVITYRSETPESDWQEVVARNLMPNPRFALSDTGWSVDVGGWSHANGHRVQVAANEWAFMVEAQAEEELSDPLMQVFSDPIPATPGTSYSAAADVTKLWDTVDGNTVARLALSWLDASGNLLSTVVGSDMGAALEARVSVVNARAPVNAASVRVCAQTLAGYSRRDTGFRWTRFMLTDGPAVLPYADGSFPGWSWTGTPHASSSFREDTGIVRNALAVAVPAGVVVHFDVVDAADFEQVRHDFRNFDAVRAAFDDFGDLADYGS